MKYYKNENNEVFAYDDGQVSKGYGKDLASITEDEMKQLTYVEPVVDPKAEGEVYTLNGVDYQVPFMKDDADGMIVVKTNLDAGVYTYTTVKFSNGVGIQVDNTNFNDFYVWFMNKRNSFFIGGN